MPKLVVIRPAETDYHWQDRLLGREDVDLNAIGREQANHLVERLSQWQFSSMAVSPQKRAIATAMPLCEENDVLLHPVAGFQAVDLGDWEGQSIETLLLGDGARYQRWLTDPDFRAPGGEAMREVYARAYSDIAHLVQQSDAGETLGFVLPLGVMQAFCCAALDLPIEAACRFKIGPAGVAVFERMFPGGPYQLVSWNQPPVAAKEFSSGYFEEEFPSV